MKNAKSFALCLLALLLFCGAFASCGKKTNELKTGTITETPAESGSAWQPLTAADRAGTDAIYEQKLAATQAFAPLPAVSGKTYYISSIHGDDSNSGTSPDKAWKSPVKAGEVPSGSAVLFECGSVFRRTQNKWFFKAVSNVVYSTYGTGAKPVFYGSVNVPASKCCSTLVCSSSSSSLSCFTSFSRTDTPPRNSIRRRQPSTEEATNTLGVQPSITF